MHLHRIHRPFLLLWLGSVLHFLGVGRLLGNLAAAALLTLVATALAGPAWALAIGTALVLTAIVAWAAE